MKRGFFPVFFCFLDKRAVCRVNLKKKQKRSDMDFRYFVPVEIYGGEDCVRKNAAVFARCGSRALIVTGKSSAKNGSLADVAAVLEANGQEYAVFDSVPPNPTVQSVEEGAALARRFGAGFIVAVGGGSPMDAAKAIAGLARQQAPEGIFAHKIGADVLPMLHIPTTAGTGSEVTPYAIITNDEKQTKTSISAPSLFPKAAFLDGKYMKDLPQSVTVNTALDAVSHAVEGMLSVRAGALSDALARESLRLLLGEYPSLSKGEYTALSRQNLLNGAALAGMVIANTGTSPVHGMGYSLTYFHGVAHGRANGLLLPAFLAVCERKIPARMSEICAALGMSVREFTDRVAALLGGRESLTDAERRDYAARAAKNKNVANCLAKFSEADLYEVLCASFH